MHDLEQYTGFELCMLLDYLSFFFINARMLGWKQHSL